MVTRRERGKVPGCKILVGLAASPTLLITNIFSTECQPVRALLCSKQKRKGMSKTCAQHSHLANFIGILTTLLICRTSLAFQCDCYLFS